MRLKGGSDPAKEAEQWDVTPKVADNTRSRATNPTEVDDKITPEDRVQTKPTPPPRIKRVAQAKSTPSALAMFRPAKGQRKAKCQRKLQLDAASTSQLVIQPIVDEVREQCRAVMNDEIHESEWLTNMVDGQPQGMNSDRREELEKMAETIHSQLSEPITTKEAVLLATYLVCTPSVNQQQPLLNKEVLSKGICRKKAKAPTTRHTAMQTETLTKDFESLAILTLAVAVAETESGSPPTSDMALREIVANVLKSTQHSVELRAAADCNFTPQDFALLLQKVTEALNRWGREAPQNQAYWLSGARAQMPRPPIVQPDEYVNQAGLTARLRESRCSSRPSTSWWM